ncbi:MAG: chemotaxis protein CheY [Firmicutes bacterium]|nr:chemotaxis protein CheY [Bacillota bacterium]
MRILIADDSLLIRTQLKDLLASLLSAEFEEAVNGVEALEKHRTFKPHVVILDYIMDAPDGLAVLKILSKIDKKVKIVMTTTLGKQKFIYKDCLANGALAILSKPITPENVVKVIQILKLNNQED